MENWQLWIIAAILLLIAEMFTPAFFMASLAIGGLVASLSAAFDLSLPWQLVAFSLGTLLGYFGARPFMLKYAHRKNEVRTNVDALTGKIGWVVERSDRQSGYCRVIVEGDDWRAEEISGQPLENGDRVNVLKVQGTLLTVQKI